MTETYHFNVPASWVWSSHIIIGIFLVYVGYSMYLYRQDLTSCKRLPNYVPIVLIVLGVLATLYHAHIWYLKDDDKDDNDK